MADRYSKYDDYVGPSHAEESIAFRKKNQKRRTAIAVASAIMSGGNQIWTTARLMKHKGNVGGVRVR